MMKQGGNFLNWMERGFALHRGWSEADRAREARERAHELETAMATAQPSGAFGDGRLGNLEDCKKAGLLNSTGLFIGAFGPNGHFLYHNSEESLLTYNRAGGGKGVSLIQPNLAHSNDRTLVIVDIKDGEHAFSSSAHRRAALGTEVVYFNPYGLHGYPNTDVNPLFRLLEVVRAGGSPDGEAESIFEIALPAPARESENAFFRKGAIQLCTLRAEFLAFEKPNECTLPDIWRFLHGDEEHFAMEFSMMATSENESVARRAQAFASMRRTAEKQWEAIRSEAASALSAFEPGKSLGNACASHDIDLTRAKREKLTIYIILPANRIDVAKPWVSMLIGMMTEVIAAARGPVRTTFIVDEFSNLPKVPSILRSLRLYRGLGVSYWFFSQGRHALTSQWSKEQVKDIEDQVGIITMKSVWEPDLLKDIELWSGTKTILQGGVSHSGGVVQTANANLSENKRPVLQAGDVIALGPTRQVIRVASMPHLLISDAVPYFTVDPWKDQVRDVRDLHKGISE
jgi:type IV secretion system protein VirD4